MRNFLVATTAALALIAAPALAKEGNNGKGGSEGNKAEAHSNAPGQGISADAKDAGSNAGAAKGAAPGLTGGTPVQAGKAVTGGAAGALNSAVTGQQQDVTGSVRQAAGQANFGNLISALNNINAQVAALNGVNVNDVTVVDASNLLQGARIRAFENALNNNNVEILNLRNNEILQNFLNDNNVDVDINDVIAVNVLSGGDIVVFTR